MTHSFWRLFLSLGLALSLFSQARADISQAKFVSKFDNFTLKKADGHYTLNGDQVSFKSFEPFLQFFKSEPEASCPKGGAPDVTVTLTINGKPVTREFLITQGLVRTNGKCQKVTGNGFFALPLHKSWFDKQEERSVLPGNSIVLTLTDDRKLEFKKTAFGWRSTDPKIFVDWHIFDETLRVLNPFTVNSRFHPAAAKESSSHFVLVTGGKTYHFYRLKEGVWGMKAPGTEWLVSSNAWGQFREMDIHFWADSHWEELSKLSDRNADLAVRTEALRHLKSEWSSAIKFVLHDILVTSSENEKVKLMAVNLLRDHPSDENWAILVRGLSATEDREIQSQITKALRIRNPQGPVLETNSSESNAKSAVAAWSSWSKTLAPDMPDKSADADE